LEHAAHLLAASFAPVAKWIVAKRCWLEPKLVDWIAAVYWSVEKVAHLAIASLTAAVAEPEESPMQYLQDEHESEELMHDSTSRYVVEHALAVAESDHPKAIPTASIVSVFFGMPWQISQHLVGKYPLWELLRDVVNHFPDHSNDRTVQQAVVGIR